MATWGKCLEDPRGNITKKMGKICFHLELETQQAPNNVLEEGRGAVLLWCTPWANWVAKPCVRESGSPGECPWAFRNVVASLDVYKNLKPWWGWVRG